MAPRSVVILLIGLHGSGKSTFAQVATRRDNIKIGKGLVETTETCGRYTFWQKVDGSLRQFTIIDTPGFADRKTTDENLEILQCIANELRELGQEQVSGVIYFHSIESPKFDGIHKENVRILKAICGEGFYSRVAIVTTRWNRINVKSRSLYEDRHEQFDKEFQTLLPGTPPAFKFLNDGKSHIPLLEHFANLDSPGHQLQFVHELDLYMSQHNRKHRRSEAKRQEVRKSEIKQTTAGKHITRKKVRSGICSFL